MKKYLKSAVLIMGVHTTAIWSGLRTLRVGTSGAPRGPVTGTCHFHEGQIQAGLLLSAALPGSHQPGGTELDPSGAAWRPGPRLLCVRPSPLGQGEISELAKVRTCVQRGREQPEKVCSAPNAHVCQETPFSVFVLLCPPTTGAMSVREM